MTDERIKPLMRDCPYGGSEAVNLAIENVQNDDKRQSSTVRCKGCSAQATCMRNQENNTGNTRCNR